MTVASGSSSVDDRRAGVVVEQDRARLGDHHRVDHDRHASEQRERLPDRLDGLPRAQHADLHGVDADVLRHRPDLLDDELARHRMDAVTPTVLCAVSAVIAVIPCTPQRANAFRSAWIPAPPPESEPAIDSTAGTDRDMRLRLGGPRPRLSPPRTGAYATRSGLGTGSV